MQGPADDGAAPGTVVEAEEAPTRPPGGKALLRLLQVLESAGLRSVADEVVARAVADDVAGEVTAAAERAGLRSPGSTPRGRSRRAAAPEDDAASTTAADLAQAYVDAADARTGPPTPTGPQWRSLGPWTITNGQTYGSSRVNVSGRVSAIATDPANAAHVLAGAANGGVWESFDRGGSWWPRTDYQATTTVGALAFDPSSPSTVYCGTGEGDWWSWLGVGVLVSTNGGTTWATRARAPFLGQGFYSLVVDPADGHKLYAGTTGGLYTSTDSGSTWTRRRSSTTWSVARARTGSEILAACQDGLFRSTTGTSWTAVTLPGAPSGFDRLAVAIAPSNRRVAYAWGARGSTAYLWRRPAGGRWRAIPTPPGASTGQAWYDWYLAVAPDRSAEIYCGAIDVHRGNGSTGTWTWVNLSSKGAGASSIHPDQHSIAFESGAPATVYAGNDGGLFRSADRGITWTHCNNGLQVSEFEYLTQDWGSSRWLLGGTQDNGTNRWTGPAAWEHVQDGDGGDCGTDRANPQTVFHTFQNGFVERSTAKGNWGSWSNITPTRPSGEGAGLFYVPFEASATTGDSVGVGGQALYLSRNTGTTWTRLAYPGGAGTASALHMPDSDTALVGLTDGRVMRARWSGGSWSITALTTPRAGAWVSDLYSEAGGTGRIWATSTRVGGGRVYRSDDGGSTWTDRSPGLPALPVNAVTVDDGNRNRVWVALDLGVWQSWDAGATWHDFSATLPNAYVGDLVFHPHARVLRAGTRNRGVWEVPVDGWMTQPVCGVQWTGTLQAKQSARWFTFNWPATWHMLWTVMPTTVAPGAPQITWNTQVERADAEHATYWITVTNLTSQPVTFEGRYCILSRY